MNNNKVLIVLIIILSSFIVYRLFFYKDKKPEVVNPPEVIIDEKDKEVKIYDNLYLTFEKNINYFNQTNDYVIFSLKGENTSNDDIYYEIKINSQNDLDDAIIFNLKEITENNAMQNDLSIDKSNIDNNVIFEGQIEGLSKINKKYKLQMLSSIKENDNMTVDINIVVNKEPAVKASEIVLKEINNHPNTTWTDVDNIIYFTGNNSVLNYNYVWYSGKLWRIMAINPDGKIKLVTDNMMTTIAWGINTEYNGSWVYQWLNEDFYDTLYNAKKFVASDSLWNYTADSGRTPKKPDTIPNQKTVNTPVGLITSYEYYVASKNNNGNYLDIKHRWWNLTPQNEGSVRSTDHDGSQDLNTRHPGNYERGIRPSIYLNTNVAFTGSGTKADPYKIVGDIKSPVYNQDLLNSRISGEYVMFDNDVYRIIDTFDNKTKIMRVDYLREGRKGIEKHIANTIVFGKSTNTKNNEWWDYYLINTWYPTISPKYQNMTVDGTYYLGEYSDYTHYKNTICIDANLDSVKTKDCNKYTASDKIYVGKVGLIRIGEMFSAQQLDYEIEPLEMWTITPFNYQENRIIHETNSLWRHKTWGGYHVVHPTFYLNSNVKITGGNGTFYSPFEISE